LTRRRKRWRRLGEELTGKRSRTAIGITDITSQDEIRKTMVGARDHGEMNPQERKKSDRQMASQDDIDTEMIPESVIGGTEIHPEKAHGNGKDGGTRSPKTTGGPIEETMTARDTGGGEKKTTTTMVGEGRSARAEADLLGVVRISTRSKKL
jgi:hypothetical protein